MTRNTRRAVTVAVAAATVALVGGSLTAAAAAPQGYDEQDREAGRFYGDFEVLLLTGDGAAAYCPGASEPTVPARVYERPDGDVDIMVNVREMPFVLYRTPLGGPEFVDATCAALSDDDPTTVPLQPFASGTGGYKERVTIAPDGVEEHRNGVNGVAVDTDGRRWKVRTWADLVVDNGVPLGDPTEFQGLVIRQIGP